MSRLEQRSAYKQPPNNMTNDIFHDDYDAGLYTRESLFYKVSLGVVQFREAVDIVRVLIPERGHYNSDGSRPTSSPFKFMKILRVSVYLDSDSGKLCWPL